MQNKIEKVATLKAPLAKVWAVISDSKAFGTWFGMTIDGPFVAGQKVTGAVAMTQVDEEIAKAQEPYVGLPCVLWVERIEPRKHFSFRWHPGAEPDTGARRTHDAGDVRARRGAGGHASDHYGVWV